MRETLMGSGREERMVAWGDDSQESACLSFAGIANDERTLDEGGDVHGRSGETFAGSGSEEIILVEDEGDRQVCLVVEFEGSGSGEKMVEAEGDMQERVGVKCVGSGSEVKILGERESVVEIVISGWHVRGEPTFVGISSGSVGHEGRS